MSHITELTTMSTIFHQGEIELQHRFGVADMTHIASRIIKNKVISGAIPFIEIKVLSSSAAQISTG